MAVRPGSHIRNPRRGYVSQPVFTALNFTPAMLPGLQLWLDASDPTTITESGGAVSQWTDKSENARTFTQGTALSQPSTGTQTIKNLNVLDFASSKILVSSAAASTWKFLHDGTKYMIALVVKQAATGSVRVIFSSTTAALPGAGIEFRYSATNTSHVVRPSTVVVNEGGGVTTNPVCISLTSDVSNATAAIRSTLYVNKNPVINNNTQTGTPSNNDPSTTLNIGGRSGTTQFWQGFIGEIVITSGSDSLENLRAPLVNYLISKWGVS